MRMLRTGLNAMGRRMSFRRASCCAISLLASIGIFLAAQGQARAQEDPADTEIRYASGLIKMGLSDYAEGVIDRLLAERPDIKDRANVVRAESAIARRDFVAAEKILEGMPKDSPKTQAIRLALADGYYLAGEEEKCSALYESFFGQYTNQIPTDPDLLRFYQQATHKYGQMLAYKDQYGAAADIYDLFLATLTDRDVKRQITLEQSELLLKAARTAPAASLAGLLEKAEANCNEVIWGGMDLWFGRAVACLAEIQVFRKDKDKAVQLLRTNLDMLKKVDELLGDAGIPVSESPLAGARSLLGSLYEEEADTLIGGAEGRQIEALRFMDKALGQFKFVWTFIVRMNKRDAVVLERAEEKTGVLTGTPADRQKPFEQMAKELGALENLLADLSGRGWEAGAAEPANKLKAAVQAQIKAVVEYDAEIGATPSADMKLGAGSPSDDLIQRGMVYLAAEPDRKKRATGEYVKALQEYYNVFIGYPGSDWSSEAGARVERLKDKLKALTGKEVTVKPKSGGREKIGRVHLTEGNDLFSRQEYDKAAVAYTKGLNDYPEGSASTMALANLMECHFRLKDPVRVKMLAHYMAERFSDRAEAAQSLLRTGRLYFDENDKVMYTALYELYLKHMPKHPVAPTILYNLGEQRWAVNDYAGSLSYYRRVIDLYPNSSYYLKALNRIGWSYYLNGKYEEAAKVFQLLSEKAGPGKEKAEGKLCLADSMQRMGKFGEALEHYRTLTKWLIEKDSHYTRSAAARGEYRDLLEQSVFFQAFCLSKIDQPADRLPSYRKASVDMYRTFTSRFPTSKLAPTALSSLGAVLLSEGKSGEAAEAYDELAERYPESEAGQNAKFAMIRSLVNIGNMDKAAEVMREMLAEAGSYPSDHFLKVGQLMAENGDPLSAVSCYTKAVEMAQKLPADAEGRQGLEQRALMGLGRAQFACENYEGAAKHISELITRYPASGLFYEARFLLGRAYKRLNRAGEAIEVLRDVFKRSSDQALINRATLELGELQMAEGNVQDALASYQRIVLLSSPDDPKVRDVYERALAESVRIFTEGERWKESIESCDLYLVNFPSGPSVTDVRKWRAKAVMRTASGS